VFNIGPLELVVLALVAIVVFGPERLPQLARDAAQLIRGLREVAKGAQTQLRDELGPEFADVDLRNLHPRTALRKALLGDDLDLGALDPRAAFRDPVTAPPAEASTPPPAPAPNGTATAVPVPAPIPPATSTETTFDSDAT
jgi:sec-independent protein translocase protein TatB